MFGYKRVEAREFVVSLRHFAQYPSAVCCQFRRKRERNWREFDVERAPTLIILGGWGHPEPPSPWQSVGDAQQSRYASCDPRWASEFSTLLQQYLTNSTGVRVLADYRGHNPHLPLPGNSPAEVSP
jgi:hypothetical protein